MEVVTSTALGLTVSGANGMVAEVRLAVGLQTWFTQERLPAQTSPVAPRQKPPAHWPVMQSVPTVQILSPTQEAPQTPPQSTSVSPAPMAPSEQVVGAQMPPWQRVLVQSVLSTQEMPLAKAAMPSSTRRSQSSSRPLASSAMLVTTLPVKVKEAPVVWKTQSREMAASGEPARPRLP